MSEEVAQVSQEYAATEATQLFKNSEIIGTVKLLLRNVSSH